MLHTVDGASGMKPIERGIGGREGGFEEEGGEKGEEAIGATYC